MHEAALRYDVDPEQLSFTNAVLIIREALAEFQMTTPEQLPRLYQRLLDDIAHYRLPQRDTRSNPRVVKRKMSKFNVKRTEHRRISQPTLPFQEVIRILN